MQSLIRTLPLIAALVAAPAFATTADQHAAHHPKGKAAAARRHKPKAAEMGCPMHDKMAQAGAKDGGQMHCMDHMTTMPHGAEVGPKPPADAAHDHDQAPPK